MKKYLTLIILTVGFNFAYPQQQKRFDGKFVYDKLVDIFHRAPFADDEQYFDRFDFSFGYIQETEPDGSITHPRANQDGDKQFNYTTRFVTGNISTTLESSYATTDRKEFKSTLEYVKGLGYKLTLHQYHNHADNDIYQMDNLMLTFVHYYDNNKFTYKIIYTINAN
jgi:hypothetical protein